MTRVLVIGMAAADYVFFVDAFPDQAAKFRATNATVVGGGCGANAAVAVAKLGCEAMLMSRLGADQVGDMILSDLIGEGVNVSLCDTTGERSSFSSVLVDARGERQIVNYRGAGLSQSLNTIKNAPAVDVVLADTRWTEGAVAAMQLAKERGVPGILDIEAPAKSDAFEAASHLAFSQQGITDFYPGREPVDAVAAAASDFDCWVCVTMGEKGVFYHGPDGAGHVPVFDVDVVDTLGAGDVWHGAFAMRLAEGAHEVEAVQFANAVAAIKCTRQGGRAGTPTRTETDEFIKEAERCS